MTNGIKFTVESIRIEHEHGGTPAVIGTVKAPLNVTHVTPQTALSMSMMMKNRLNNYAGNVSIEKVIFNDPATIVFWDDGTKTAVKTQNGEAFDPEKGITMAYFKKMHGNKGSYFNEIKKWVDTYTELVEQTRETRKIIESIILGKKE